MMYKFIIIWIYSQAKGWRDFEKKMKASYWTALKMNWKVWTPFQFININFVPVQVFHWHPVIELVMSHRLTIVMVFTLSSCFSVPGAVCQHGRLILVRLSCICEEMKLPEVHTDNEETASQWL